MKPLMAHWAEAALTLFGMVALAVLLVKQTGPATPADPRYLGKPLSTWIARLDAPDFPTAIAAVRTIGPKGVPYLLSAMAKGDSTDGAPQAALLALGNPALPAVTKAFDDPHQEVRLAAIRAATSLAPHLGSDSDAVVAKSLKLLRDPSFDVRLETEIFLGAAGPSRRLALSALIGVLKRRTETSDEDRNAIVEQAMHVVAQCGEEAHKAIPVLLELLTDSNAGLRQQAASALWKIDRSGTVLLPALARLMEQPGNVARPLAADLLLRMSEEKDWDTDLVQRAREVQEGHIGVGEVPPCPYRAGPATKGE